MRLLHTASFVVQVTETIPRSMTLGSRSMALVKLIKLPVSLSLLQSLDVAILDHSRLLLRFAHVLASLHVRLCRERHI